MPIIDPETIKPLGGKILVRKYTKPDQWKSIVLAEAYKEDDTGSLWEVIGPMGPKVERILGIIPKKDDLIKTPPWRGLHAGEDAEGTNLFFIEAAEVASVYVW